MAIGLHHLFVSPLRFGQLARLVQPPRLVKGVGYGSHRQVTGYGNKRFTTLNEFKSSLSFFHKDPTSPKIRRKLNLLAPCFSATSPSYVEPPCSRGRFEVFAIRRVPRPPSLYFPATGSSYKLREDKGPEAPGQSNSPEFSGPE